MRSFTLRLPIIFLAAILVCRSVQPNFAQESSRVDVPAIAPACEWFDPFEESPTSDLAHPQTTAESIQAHRFKPDIEPMGERLIEVVVPISWWLPMQRERRFQSCEIEIAWARSLYPMVDYWPRSTLQSAVEGLIKIEQQSERKATASVTTNGLLKTLATSGSLTGEARGSSNQQFAAIPERTMLIASGPVERGTGAFFRFYDSPHELVQGGREVRLIFRVPDYWRGGLLRIDAAVNWSKANLLNSKEIQSDRKSFLLPLYLEGDVAARDRAIAYAQAEAKLREAWHEAQNISSSQTILQQLRTLGRAAEDELPTRTLESLILSFNETPKPQSSKQPATPAQVESALKSLHTARSELLKLSQAENSTGLATR